MNITKGTILLCSAGTLCVLGLDVVGVVVAGYGVYCKAIKVSD